MPRKKFSDEQIAFALRQAETGTPVGEICRKMGVAEATFYRRKKVYAGTGSPRSGGSSSWRKRMRSSSGWWRT